MEKCNLAECEKCSDKSYCDYGDKTTESVSDFYKKYNNRKVNICGVDWTIRIVPADDDRLKNSIEANGVCESYTKEVFVRDYTEQNDPKQYLNIEMYVKKVIRHELIHAFFFETAHQSIYEDETITETLAQTLPKLAKIMEEADLM